jgi:predicted PurR-regulated permease PerM
MNRPPVVRPRRGGHAPGEALQESDSMETTPGPARETEKASWRQSVASGAAVALLLGAGVYVLSGYLHALVWALVFAIALWPLYGAFRRRWRASAEMGAMLFTALVGAIVIAPVAMLAVDAAVELRQLVDYARATGDAGLPAPQALARLPYAGPWLAEWWATHLSRAGWAKDLLHQLDNASTREFGALLGANAIHRTMLFIVCLLTLFFLFRSGDAVIAQSRAVSRKLFGARGETLAAQVVVAVRGTLNGLVLVGLGEGAIMLASYLLTRTPHPILLGVLTAFAAMIPFAAAVAIGLAAIVAGVSVGAAPAMIIVATGAVVVFVADHFVRPALIGGETRIPFLWVLLGILGGVESFALLGLFVGPAIMAALVSLWRDLAAPTGTSEKIDA